MGTCCITFAITTSMAAGLCSWRLQHGHMASTGLLFSSDQYQLLQRKMNKPLQ